MGQMQTGLSYLKWTKYDPVYYLSEVPAKNLLILITIVTWNDKHEF